jgi:hypothetical protein
MQYSAACCGEGSLKKNAMHLSWIDIAIVLVYIGFTILAGSVAGMIKNMLSDRKPHPQE